MFYIGIDNSSLTHSVCIINEEEQKIKEFFINNNFDGFKKLHTILDLYQDYKIGFELPHGPLIDYFNINNIRNIYSFNPLKIKRFKDLQNVSGDKSDKIDAFAIASYLKKYDDLKPIMFNSKEIEKLNVFRISHDRLTKEHSRYLNKLHFLIRQCFPLLDDLFSSFGCKVMLKMLLKYPKWQDLQKVSSEEIKKFLILNNYRVGKYIQKIIDKIKNYDQVITDEVEIGLSIEIKTITTILLTIKREIENIENEMDKITISQELGKVFKSLPGAGIVLSSKLFAIFGDNKKRFNKSNDVQCLFGTAPKNYQSGNYHKVLMRKACNKHSRATLYKFAFSTLRLCTWARDYYDKQKLKGKTHSVSVRALSNKWVKIIFCLWKNNEIYSNEKYINQKLKIVA